MHSRVRIPTLLSNDMREKLSWGVRRGQKGYSGG